MTATTMHSWPNNGEVTTCCGRTVDELPLLDGRTTDPSGVNCDGTFTPAVFAHEVYPHPSDDYDKVPLLADAAKYHAARALAFANDDVDHPDYMNRLRLMIAERAVALHVAALARGLSGQEALSWVHRYQDDSNELLFDLCIELGVDLGRIRPYPLPKTETSSSLVGAA